MNDKQIQQMVDGYLEAVDFAERPDGQHPRFPQKTVDHARADCLAFIAACGPLADKAVNDIVGYSAVQFGRDFWFTRAGHGVGFWDRPELEVDTGFVHKFKDRDGEELTAIESDELGETLTAIAYGGQSFISPFAYADVYAYRGWYYF